MSIINTSQRTVKESYFAILLIICLRILQYYIKFPNFYNYTLLATWVL